jgi:hypothetical protein
MTNTKTCSVYSTEEDVDDVDDVGIDDDDPNISEVPDPYAKVYSNVLLETHMLNDIDNCEHCNAKNHPDSIVVVDRNICLLLTLPRFDEIMVKFIL